jgi:3',5'-cyclic AMP phosphodiesterase CpdA
MSAPIAPPSDVESWDLAHLSDLHLTDPLLAAGPLRFKQRVGRRSWLLRRRAIHQPAVLDALAADLHGLAPGHIAIGGDLVQLGLPQEFAQAARWLATFAPPQRVTLVPGNHEAYLPGSWRAGAVQWQAYRPATVDGAVVEQRGDLLVIGLSSAVATALGLATGRVCRAQLASLEDALAWGARERLFRVIVLHHPPTPVVGWRKRLIDRAQLAAIVARHGAGIILHGHAHRATCSVLAGPRGAVPVLGAPAASALDARPGRMAGYIVLRVCRAVDGWRLHVRRRVYRQPTRDFGWADGFDVTTRG